MRLLPKSLLGQTLLAVAAALLVAQAVTTALLYRAAENRREDALLTAATLTLWGDPIFRRARGEEELQNDRRSEQRRGMRGRGRFLRGEVTNNFPLQGTEENHPARAAELERRLTNFLAQPHRVLVIERSTEDDGVLRDRARGWRPVVRQWNTMKGGRLLVAAVQWENGGPWHVARMRYGRDDRRVFFVTTAQTFVMLVLLMLVLFLLLRRITRPLAALSDRTHRFAGSGEAEAPLTPSGPEDVRGLIEAHNAMQARIGSMLDEKDVMLGAIGHDLKTPLAALRVRIESVEDEAARDRMAASIEDITQTLDEILSLARIGKGNGAPEMTEIGALAASVVEEFEDMGEDVTLETERRIAAPVHITWLKRGLRNLLSNALRYAGSARVSVLLESNTVLLRVDDDGPGIPENRIQDMLEPFTRGEASRNRETGGAGLGLTLARAVAEQHGGALVLANRSEGGLRAEIRLPTE